MFQEVKFAMMDVFKKTLFVGAERYRRILANKCRCAECGEELESKTQHDFVRCHCKNGTFTDGGRAYIRQGGVDLSKVIDMSEYEDVSIKPAC